MIYYYEGNQSVEFFEIGKFSIRITNEDVLVRFINLIQKRNLKLKNIITGEVLE